MHTSTVILLITTFLVSVIAVPVPTALLTKDASFPVISPVERAEPSTKREVARRDYGISDSPALRKREAENGPYDSWGVDKREASDAPNDIITVGKREASDAPNDIITVGKREASDAPNDIITVG